MKIAGPCKTPAFAVSMAERLSWNLIELSFKVDIMGSLKEI